MPKKEAEETAPAAAGQGRAAMDRYRLQVDRQTKTSYATHEAAEAAGAAIKTAHPLVHVSIYDARERHHAALIRVLSLDEDWRLEANQELTVLRTSKIDEGSGKT